MSTLPRRAVLAALLAAAAALLPRRVAALPRRRGPHPDPRPGITAAKVATADQLQGNREAIEVFDLVREIPEVADGIRCQCSCADHPDYRSLLTCFEAPDAMALLCEVCKAEARFVHRQHKAGRSLADIRRAVDARFG